MSPSTPLENNVVKNLSILVDNPLTTFSEFYTISGEVLRLEDYDDKLYDHINTPDKVILEVCDLIADEGDGYGRPTFKYFAGNGGEYALCLRGYRPLGYLGGSADISLKLDGFIFDGDTSPEIRYFDAMIYDRGIDSREDCGPYIAQMITAYVVINRKLREMRKSNE